MTFSTRSSWIAGFRYVMLFIATIVVAEVLRTFLGLNFQTVLPSRLYRSAQPDWPQLKLLTHRLNLQTVINLRGDDGTERYWEEAKVAREMDVTYRCDVNISAAEMPDRTQFHNLVDALCESPEPVLIHCWSGSDRTGLVVGLYLLLRTDASLDTAKSQLSIRYGHFSMGRAKRLNRIFAEYERWLMDNRLSHSPEHLKRWASEGYDPALLNYDLPSRKPVDP